MISVLIMLTSQILPIQAGYYVSQLLNGLFLGMVLALASVGLTLVFGVMKIINFAHGATLTAGAYVGLEINRLTGSFVLAVVLGTLSTGILGLAIEITLIRRLYDRENVELEMVTLTFGLAFIIRELIIINWGSDSQFINLPAWMSGNVSLGFISYPTYRMITIALSTAIVVGTYLCIKETKTGMMIQAGSKDREMARMVGIDMKRLGAVGFAVGSGLAGLAGIIIAPVRNAYPLIGFELLLPAFVIVLTGGMGSVAGTIGAALIIGQIITIVSLFAAPLSDIIVFVVMAVVLVVKSDSLAVQGGV